MSKIKVIGLLLAIIAVLGFAGTASAADYVVNKGDSLWKIAYRTWGTGKLWQAIARENNISNPKKLSIGKRLNIPDVGIIKITQHGTASFGAKGMRGDTKVLASIDATPYPQEVKEALKKAILENEPVDYILMRGEYVDCFSDKFSNVVGPYCNPEGYEFAWKKALVLPAKRWTVEIDNQICYVYVINECGNFASRCEIVVTPPESPKITVPEKPKGVTLPPAEKKIELPKQEKPELSKIKYPQCKHILEHEPIIGIYGYLNGAAKGWGTYGEYMLWLRKDCGYGYLNGWSPGVGIYGYYSAGESRISTFEWKEYAAGPEAGLKYIAVDDKGRPWQWQGKFRVVREWMKGQNAEGYWADQDNWKAGIYTEYVRRENEKWLWGLTGEAWWTLNKEVHASIPGIDPSKRTTVMAAAFVQRKINDFWQTRFAAMPAWTEWDNQYWFNLIGELRYDETVMFGPSIGIPLGVSSINKSYGLDAGDLFTWRGFVRVEFGKPLRDLDMRAKSQRVRLIGGPEFEERKLQETLDNRTEPVKLQDPVLSISPIRTQDF
jgi:LysM repeat protein